MRFKNCSLLNTNFEKKEDTMALLMILSIDLIIGKFTINTKNEKVIIKMLNVHFVQLVRQTTNMGIMSS